MTRVNDERQKYEQAMEYFKGKRYTCFFCGMEGEYEKDLDPLLVTEGELGILQGNIYTTTFKASFHCKDRDACQKRKEGKKKG